MRLRSLVLPAVAMMLMPLPAFAQTTTGRLIGKVVDDTAGALPGATVTITSPVLIGGPRVKITDSAGEFAFVGLSPGEYSVKADLSGFVSQERNEVQVALGGSRSITIEMPLGTFGGEIEVVAETPMVDPTQVNTNATYTDTYMQGSAIGSNNRSYQSVLYQAAGVAGGDNPRVFGSTDAENAYYVDGANTTDPVTATFGTNFTFDSIQEIQFQTSGYEAEYGTATGGIVNLVTKSGGNRFSGTVDIRYRSDAFNESGDHYDAGRLDSQRQEVDLTLGGPILRDTLWFFVAYQYVNNDSTPIGSPSTTSILANLPLAKLTWQAGSNWRVTGKWTADPADFDNWNASPFVEPEAGAFQSQGSDIYSAEVNGVLSDSLVWNSVLSAYRSALDAYPQTGDLETIGHYNLVTGVLSANYTGQQYSERNRDDITTNLTWFVDDLAGSHEFKGGLVYSDLNFTSSLCSTGTAGGVQCESDVPGNVFYDIEFGGDFPLYWYEDYNSGTQEFKGSNSSLFLQDAWRVTPNLTLKLGIRYDIAKYDTDNATQIADMSKWQPRVGAAWDLTGDAKNIVRANWGHFMSPNSLTLPYFARTGIAPSYEWLSCSYYGLSAEQCQGFANAIGIPWSMDPENWDPAGWLLSYVYGSLPSQIDPDLKAMYTETFSFAFEREVGRRASLTLTYVDKKTKDGFEDTCDGNLGPAGPNADANCDFYVMANLPEITRDYSGFVVEYSTRTFDWLTLNASYTYSKSKGSQEGDQNSGTDFDVYPAYYVNRYGYLSDHRENRFKLNGFFTIKGDWTIGFDGFYSSAFTWQPTANSSNEGQVWEGNQIPDNIPGGGLYYVEPRGNRDANSNYQLDLQLSKGFHIGQAVRIVLIGSVFNLFSNQEVTQVCSSINGCTDVNGDFAATGGPTNWQTPRRYEVGFRFEF